MAEILIKLIKEPNDSDPRVWTRGHPIVVKPDGHEWGALETLPRFFVLAVTDLSVAQAMPYVEVDEENGSDPNLRVLLAARKWFLDIDAVDLPNWVKIAIRDTGRVTVTKAQIVNFFKRTRVV